MEGWIETLVAAWEVLRWLAMLGVGGAVARFFYISQIRDMKRRIADLEHQAEPETAPENEGASDPAADFAEAMHIVSRYVASAMQDSRPGVELSVCHGFLDQFSQTPGAMLGEGQYNRERLRQWVESNAARFLVEHRDDMR